MCVNGDTRWERRNVYVSGIPKSSIVRGSRGEWGKLQGLRRSAGNAIYLNQESKLLGW